MFHIHAAATPDGAFSFELDMPADLFAALVFWVLEGNVYGDISEVRPNPASSANLFLTPSYYLDQSNR